MRWRILALLFFARIGMGLQFQTMASVGDDLIVAFGLDYAGLGLLIGLFMAPGLFLALPAGFSGRYASDRVLAVSGMAALAVGGLLSASAPDSWTLGLGRVVAGAGFLFGTLYFTKMVADWFIGREIATAMSVLVMSWPFGIAMGQIGHTWLAGAYGWRVPFHAASAYCLLAAVALLLFYRPPSLSKSTAPAGGTRLTGREWRMVLCAGTAWGAFNAGYVIYLTFGPKMLESLGATALKAAAVISVGSWLMILSGAVCGQIADRFGRRDTILAVCMTAAAASLALLGLPGGGLAASLLFGLVGMAPAGVIMALAGEAMRPDQRAFGMGVFFTVYHAIMMASPPVAGAILDATGAITGPILLGMVLFAAVVPAALGLRWLKAGHVAANTTEA
jgi:MFS family permease